MSVFSDWFRVDFCRPTQRFKMIDLVDCPQLPPSLTSMAEPPSKRSKTSTPSAEAGPSTPIDNPYLAHRNPVAPSTMASGTNGVAPGVKNPLAGLVPRRVSVEQAKNIMVSPRNAFLVVAGGGWDEVRAITDGTGR